MIIILEKKHNKLSIIQYLNKESQLKLNLKESPGTLKKIQRYTVEEFC